MPKMDTLFSIFIFPLNLFLFYAYELPTCMFICTTCARKYPWRPEKDVDP